MKTRTPSKTQVSKTLAESLFDPRAKSPMSVVVSFNDPTYCGRKATELIAEAEAAYSQGQVTDYHERVTQAISLLALARLQRGPDTA